MKMRQFWPKCKAIAVDSKENKACRYYGSTADWNGVGVVEERVKTV